MNSQHNKAIVSLIMSILLLLEVFWGVDHGLNEMVVVTLVAIASPILVWLIPNRG